MESFSTIPKDTEENEIFSKCQEKITINLKFHTQLNSHPREGNIKTFCRQRKNLSQN